RGGVRAGQPGDRGGPPAAEGAPARRPAEARADRPGRAGHPRRPDPGARRKDARRRDRRAGPGPRPGVIRVRPPRSPMCQGGAVASTDSPSTRPAAATRARSPLFSAVIGLAGLAILLQGVWAGLFIHEREEFQQNWVNVHSIGGTVIAVLALIAMIIAIVQLRSRRDVLGGSIVFFVLVVLEVLLGGFIGDHPALEALHIPLALFLMGMVAVLSFRASRPEA